MKPLAKPLRILILDDDPDVLATLRRIVELNGHTAKTTTLATEAAALVANGGFDFALVDYKLPDKDGLWFMENARIPRGTRVLLITAYVNREVVNRMFRLGASGYLIKPFDEQDLMRSLMFFAS